MKLVFNTLTIVSLLGFSSISIADTDTSKIDPKCFTPTLNVKSKAEKLWFQENCSMIPEGPIRPKDIKNRHKAGDSIIFPID